MSHFKFKFNSYMSHMLYKVIEGIHKNPNDKSSIIIDSIKEYGPFKNKDMAYKCGWTPFNDLKIKGDIYATLVNGKVKI